MSEGALLLGVDTSRDGDLVLAKLFSGGDLTLLAQQQFSSREQSAELIPRLTQLLAAGQVSLDELGAIVVVHGPRQLHRLRIGLAAVKGLAHATKIPVIAVSSLAVLAGMDPKATVAVLIAGRSEYYVRRNGADDVPVESLQSEDELLADLGDARVVVADATLADRLSQTLSHVTLVHPGALEAIRTALPRFFASDFEDISSLDANYVRRPYTDRPEAAPVTSAPAR